MVQVICQENKFTKKGWQWKSNLAEVRYVYNWDTISKILYCLLYETEQGKWPRKKW